MPVTSVRARQRRWASPPESSWRGTVEEAPIELGPFERVGCGRVGELRFGDPQVVAHRSRERRRSLEHHPDATAEVPGVEPGHVVAAEADPTRRRNLEPVAESEQRRLAGPRGAGDDGHPDRRDAPLDVGQEWAVGPVDTEVLEGEERVADGRIVAPSRTAATTGTRMRPLMLATWSAVS